MNRMTFKRLWVFCGYTNITTSLPAVWQSKRVNYFYQTTDFTVAKRRR